MVKTQKSPLAFTRSRIFCGMALLAAVPCLAADDPLEHAKAVLARHPVIDGHNDLPWAIRESATAPRDVVAYDLRRRTAGATDIERLRQGGVGGQFWSVYVPYEPVAASTQLEQIDIARRIVERYPEALAFASSADQVERAMRNGKRRVAARHGGRTRDRELARGAASLLRPRRPLHDAHPLQDAGLGRLRHRRGAPRRPHALRRGGGARDEPAGDAGGPLARLAGHHGATRCASARRR